MDTNRLSAAMQEALIKQLTKEANAAQIYLAYGSWADVQGYGGIANFLFRHAGEERDHMMKILEYILERGGTPRIEAIAAPPENPSSLVECFNRVFQHEVDNTTAIYNIVNLALEEKDWATWNFGQWFVKEQIEEEKLVMDLIDKLKIAGGDNAGNDSLFTLDESLKNTPDGASLAREATVEKP